VDVCPFVLAEEHTDRLADFDSVAALDCDGIEHLLREDCLLGDLRFIGGTR
jgi:hypothetical protein